MKKNMYSYFTYVSILISFFLFQPNFGYAQLCNCTEYLYLNEPANSVNQGIHKFELNGNYNPADPASSVIGQEIGSPWFDNNAANETLTNPHGLAVDLNGNIYVGETNSTAGGIRKLRCDGTILPTSEYYIPNEGGYSFATVGNTLYVNTQDNDDNSPNYINAYDLCTGALIGFYCLDGIVASRQDWGLYIDDNGILYATNDFRAEGGADDVPNNLFVVNTNTTPLSAPGDTNPACVPPFISQGATGPAVGSNAFARDRVFGVVADTNGFIYVVERTFAGEPDFPGGVPDATSRILKYDSNGNLVAVSAYDSVEGNGGYFRAIGIFYSKTLDLIFVSTASPTDDCVSLFDTNLNYLGSALPSPGDGTTGKAIFITEECCPTSTPIVEDITLCNPTLGEQVFLLDLIGCPLCDGNWSADPTQNDFNFDDCNNSIVIDALNECGSFTLTSNGLGQLAQCTAFELTINVCTPTTAEPAISVTDNVCDPETAGSINVDTPCPADNTIEYSTDGGTNWSATAPVYDTANSVTVRARCVNTAFNTCISTETGDFTTTPEVCDTCPPVNCVSKLGEFTIQKRIP